jgi:enoyl-CoA hydratase
MSRPIEGAAKLSGESAVCVWYEGKIGRIHLNRPASLNALNNSMVRVIVPALDEFERRDDIRAIAITGEGGRSFCAGGDLKEIYYLAQRDPELAARIWSDEYILNVKIASCSKPWICLVDGICMGAGMALAIHKNPAILFPGAELAMPEIRIGFYPDVGVTFRLSRLPDYLGFYFALSGKPISAPQAVVLGLAQAVVSRNARAEVISAIGNDDAVERIRGLALPTPETVPAELAAFCNDVFCAPSWNECSQALGKHRSRIGDEFRDTISAFSPAALELTFSALVHARSLPSVQECLRRDMTINRALLTRHDFLDGIRSLFFRRETKPIWKDEPHLAWLPEFQSAPYMQLQGSAFSE